MTKPETTDHAVVGSLGKNQVGLMEYVCCKNADFAII